MRYYVIMNGVNSLTIQGLAIRELPPISKPLMRNIREEIDGRNGDIITELGYSAYDKQIEIGLYGNSYDINDIIAFFNGKGTITFSDEPDKYYYYQILNQIDYEKLLKFKTASVVFHCQPFKYKVNEVPLEEEYEYVEGEGTNITLNNTANAIFSEFDLKGNTSQDGTPTPTNPIEVETTTGNQIITICGKNLFSSQMQLGTIDNDTGQNANGGNSIRSIDYIRVEPNTTYTISSTMNYHILIHEYNKDKSYIQYDGNYGSPRTFTTTSNTYYIRVRSAAGQVENDLNAKYQLELGGTPSTYEEYKGNDFEINLGTMELCKIGDYQDYLYKENNTWYINRKINKIVLNGSETWGRTSNVFYTTAITDYATSDNIPYSNYFEGYSNVGGSGIAYNEGDLKVGFIQSSGQTTPRFYLRYDDLYNGTLGITINAWLTSHNTNLYYNLVTPIDEEITDEELISQLDALMLAQSQKGQTNIIQGTANLPFIIKVSALKDNSDHLIINNIGNTFAKPTLDLEGTGIVDIYLNDVQVFQVDLSEVNEIVLNTADMEAYNPTTHELANRQVTGDYSNFKLDVGENDLRFSGNLTKATVTYYQRWL